MIEGKLLRVGFCILRDAVSATTIRHLLGVFDDAVVDDFAW